MYHVTSVLRGLVLMAVMLVAMTSTLLADGNETLGPPSISISAGSGVVTAGIGLTLVQPGIINLNVPAGATINQVLIYWEGQHSTPNGDNVATVGGNNVVGTLIGGPDFFFSTNNGTLPIYSSTYRADITSLALVSSGANAISVSDLSNDVANNGAGLFVIYDDGTPTTAIQLVDGNDLAYKFFPSPRTTTVAQTFTFGAALSPRTATLSMFFSSVEGLISTGGVLRPNEVRVTVGATTTVFTDELLSNDGQEWDTMTKLINVPAGETQMTVVAVSGPGGDDDPNTPEPRPASFAWNACGLNIPSPPPPCTGKIGNFVWKDNDCDGTQEAGELGIPNVTVQLLDAAGVNVLKTTTTNASGYYLFDSLCADSYTVKVLAATLPAGYTATTCSNVAGNGTNSNCSPSPVVLTDNSTQDLTIDFGYCAPNCTGKIGNFVWKDTNCNGTQNTGEPGLAGVTVKLYDAAGTTLLKTTVTNSTGYYEFDSLCASTYTVKVETPAGYYPTTCSNVANNGTNSNCSPSPVTLTTNSSQDLTIDFGFCPCTGKIGDRIWNDTNCNGTQNTGEPGLAGVMVKLYDGTGTTLLKTTVTNSTGYYKFEGLCAGSYVVKVDTTTLPSGYTATTCSNVANNNTNSNCSPSPVTLTGNASQDLTIDFGYCPPPQTGCAFLIIDEDGLDNGLHFNQSGGPITPDGPQFFSASGVNDDIPGHKQRSVLRYFASNVGRTITVRTGQTGDEGWFAPNCAPAKWISTNSSTNNTCLTGSNLQTAINNYLGRNGASAIPAQDRLDKIPDVRPLRALGLNGLIGKCIIAVVYDSDISINYDHGTPLGVNGNLQGECLGIVAFRVNEVRTLNGFSSSTLPEVQITILDVNATSNALYGAPIPSTSSIPNDRIAPGSPSGYLSLGTAPSIAPGTAEEVTTPEKYALLQNYPNPFNPETEISFALPMDSDVELKIFNTLGQEVRLLAQSEYRSGVHSIRWDGRDNNGSSVPSGVYFYKLRAGEFSQIKKMSVLK